MTKILGLKIFWRQRKGADKYVVFYVVETALLGMNLNIVEECNPFLTISY